MTPMSVSASGLARIRQFEGYLAAPAPTPEGHWAVGHGHVRTLEPGAPVTRQEAAELLARDVATIALVVNNALTISVSQRQFDALVSFAFSIGADAFEASAVPRLVNSGALVAAACAMDSWRKADVDGALVPVAALVRRRAAEKALFLADVKLAPAASALARPQLDHAAAILGGPFAGAASPGKRLTEILMSEPATAELLLTTPASEAQIAEAEEDEIVTAHAKPVARAGDRPAVSGWAAKIKSVASRAADHIGLVALFGFGCGMLALAGTMVLGGRGDLVDLLSAAALAAPGVTAVAMSSFGLVVGARPV